MLTVQSDQPGKTAATQMPLRAPHREVIPWTDDEGVAYVLVAYWANRNMHAYNGYIKQWLQRLGKSQTVDLHQALLAQGLVPQSPTSTALLLAGKGPRPKQLTAAMVRVMLEVIGIHVWWAMIELRVAAPPEDSRRAAHQLQPPYPVGVVAMVDAMRREQRAHELFGLFVQRQLLPAPRALCLCAAHLVKAGVLTVADPVYECSTLVSLLRGHQGRGRRLFMNLPQVLEISAFAGVSPQRMLGIYQDWRNDMAA